MRAIRLATSLVLLSALACSDSPTEPGIAQFRVRDVHGSRFHIQVSDQAAAREARDLLRSGEERWVVGRLLRGDGGFNRPWGWHFQAATVRFAEVTAEACQTAAAAIDADLDYWLRYGTVCVGGQIEAEES